MYEIIRNVIDSKDYKLEDMLYKINKMYIEGRISEEEKSELDNMARSNAKVENSYDIQKQLDNIFSRLEALENKNIEIEDTTEPVEEYPEFIQPTGAHNSYNSGAKTTFKGKRYICQMDNCVWSPDTYPAAWKEVIENTEV